MSVRTARITRARVILDVTPEEGWFGTSGKEMGAVFAKLFESYHVFSMVVERRALLVEIDIPPGDHVSEKRIQELREQIQCMVDDVLKEMRGGTV